MNINVKNKLTAKDQLAISISGVEYNACWICNEHGALEEHHIIPRSYGGTYGPTVLLCATCHSEIDKLSRKQFLTLNLSTKSILSLCKGDYWKSDYMSSRAYWLAKVIYKSRRVSFKLMRPVKMIIKLSGEERQQLKILKASHPNLTQVDVLHLALQDLYYKETGIVKK